MSKPWSPGVWKSLARYALFKAWLDADYRSAIERMSDAADGDVSAPLNHPSNTPVFDPVSGDDVR